MDRLALKQSITSILWYTSLVLLAPLSVRLLALFLLVVKCGSFSTPDQMADHDVDAGNVIAGLLGTGIVIVIALAAIGMWARRSIGAS